MRREYPRENGDFLKDKIVIVHPAMDDHFSERTIVK